MHASELLPIAALIADCGKAFIRTPMDSSSPHLHQYWASSRQRLDHWSQAFNEATANSLSGVVEEVLLSEVLTRVWTAAATAHDAFQKNQTVGPVARSIYLGHQEARHRALLAIVKLHGLRERDARRLNLLRQKCERWTDLLLAYFPLHGEIEPLAFEPRRCKEFAIDMHHEAEDRQQTQALTMASLESVAQSSALCRAVNGELNQSIAAAVFGCLPAEVIDESDSGSLLWQTRIESTTNDTLDLVAELLSLECPSQR